LKCHSKQSCRRHGPQRAGQTKQPLALQAATRTDRIRESRSHT
jgi:hypothetical protein